MWYLDDGTICGDTDVVFSDFERIRAANNTLGLKVNPPKCEIICLDSAKTSATLEKFRSIAPDIKQAEKENLLLLHASVLSSSVDCT